MFLEQQKIARENKIVEIPIVDFKSFILTSDQIELPMSD